MPTHSVKTLMPSRFGHAVADYQDFHSEHVQEYTKLIFLVYKTPAEREILRQQHGGDLRHLSIALRGLTVVTSSVLLGRFDALVKKARLSWDTKTNSINEFRRIGLNCHHFLTIVHRKTGNDGPINTAKERVAFMAQSSPKIAILYYFLLMFAVPQADNSKPDERSKLLITDRAPASACIIELACELVGIRCQVLHSGLTTAQRGELVKSFNDPSSRLRVMVIMYDVGLMGVNLDVYCWNVLS